MFDVGFWELAMIAVVALLVVGPERLPKLARTAGLWLGKVEKSPREEFLYYTSQGSIEGIRQGNWKLLVKKPRANRNNPEPSRPPRIFLFDLNSDLAEQNNVASKHPEILSRLRTRMEELDAEITANARAPWRKG